MMELELTHPSLFERPFRMLGIQVAAIGHYNALNRAFTVHNKMLELCTAI